MRYEKYKKTGIAWLPEVPEEWEVVPFKRVSEVKANLVHPSEYLSMPQVSPEQIEKVTGKLLLCKTVEESNVESDNHLFFKGQILYSKIRPLLNKVTIAPFNGLCSADMYPIETTQDVAYVKFAMLSRVFLNGVANAVADRVKMPKINKVELGGVPIPLPPLSEQRVIAGYLDEKCGKVDALVAAKERQVELLKEMKQSMIADAVTKGVGFNAEKQRRREAENETSRTSREKTKPSGIPWLPEVPEGWEVRKVRQHFKLRSTKVSEKDFPALSVAKIGVVPQLSDVAISMAEGDSRKLVRRGDYVVNSRSDRKGSCGIAPRDGSVTTISIVLEPHDINSRFVHYLFRSVPWVEEFYRNGRGIVADLWTTRYQEMRNMIFPYPPLAEQKAIVAHIEERAAKIDATISGLQKEISLLKEYRERLIADVVTGQRRVNSSTNSADNGSTNRVVGAAANNGGAAISAATKKGTAKGVAR